MTMPPDHECITKECVMEERIRSLEEANKNHSRTHEGMFDRIRHLETENAVQNANYKATMDMLGKMDQKNDRLVEKVESIEKCVTAQLQTMTDMNERGKENKRRLDAIEAKPGKRWESIVDKAVWAVCAAVIAFLLARLGLSA